MRGLVIKKVPPDKFLPGQKTWEMHNRRCNVREKIALIEGRSGKVLSIAEVVDCHGPLSADQLKNSRGKHQADEQSVAASFGYKPEKVFAWEPKRAQRLSKPVRYQHPSGAQTWVTLDAIDDKIMKGVFDSGGPLAAIR